MKSLPPQAPAPTASRASRGAQCAALALSAAACGDLRPAVIRTGPPPAAVTHHLDGPPGELTLIRVAHATILLQTGDLAVLADPWFSSTRDYNQGEELAFGVSGLPHLDAVINSHGHYDHYDMETFAAYPDHAVPMIVRDDMVDKARQAGFTDVRALDHWDTTDVAGIHVTATPAQHSEPENTYILEMGGFTIFFGADSLKIPEFQKIHESFPSIDLAVLPVNGLTVTTKGQVVMGPTDAAQVAGLLDARVAIPIHYKYYGSWYREAVLLNHPGTAEEFVAAARTEAPHTATYILETGQPLHIERSPAAAVTP